MFYEMLHVSIGIVSDYNNHFNNNNCYPMIPVIENS